jgi:hypothetical protein
VRIPFGLLTYLETHLSRCGIFSAQGQVSDIPVVSQLPETSATYTVPLDHFSGTPSSATVMSDTQSVGPHSTISLQMAHSTMVPHVATIPTGNVTPSQAPIGTPLRPNPSLPLGYRALNPSIANTTQVTPGVSRIFVPLDITSLLVLYLHLYLEELVLVALIQLEHRSFIHFWFPDPSRHSTSRWGETSIWGQTSNQIGTQPQLGGNLRLESITHCMDRM